MAGLKTITTICWTVCLLSMLTVVVESVRLPFQEKKAQSPLLFFKVPPGLIPAVDEAEKTIKEVEKELGVKVERVDILRNPAGQALMGLLTQKSPPFLYNRLSCQSIDIPTQSSSSSGQSKSLSPALDKERVRAWALGRLVPAARTTSKASSMVASPLVLSRDETAIDQEELLEDMALTPLQREGKEAIRERTAANAQAGTSSDE